MYDWHWLSCLTILGCQDGMFWHPVCFGLGCWFQWVVFTSIEFEWKVGHLICQLQEDVKSAPNLDGGIFRRYLTILLGWVKWKGVIGWKHIRYITSDLATNRCFCLHSVPTMPSQISNLFWNQWSTSHWGLWQTCFLNHRNAAMSKITRTHDRTVVFHW